MIAIKKTSRLILDSIVMVHPSHSLLFGKRWGKIQKIHPDDGLPIKVQFDNMNTLYGFSDNELMTDEEVEKWDRKKVIDYCYKCGEDLTGKYTYICDSCAFPIP